MLSDAIARVRRIFVVLLALTTALLPLLELFDRWDTASLPSNDTEFRFTCLLVILDLFVLLAQILPAILRSIRIISLPLGSMTCVCMHQRYEVAKTAPFLPSTIPLRI